MNTFLFGPFRFDPQTLELRKQDESVELRPKTAELLRVLISHRDQVVDKRALIARIWHTEHVTDQSVFQAMSELRRQLAPLKPIKTFPNRGYQWVLPVTEETAVVPPHAMRRWRMAAAAAVIGVGVFMANGAWLSPTAPEMTRVAVPTTSLSLPALVAFSEGASAMQRGEVDKAVELLELSVLERPEFVEARLLLAEAYLLNGQPQEARQRVDSVMNQLTPDTNAYSLIAAMELLSRTDHELGAMSSALEWAARAADQANSNGFECTAADLHDRVIAMASDPAVATDVLKTSPVFASDFARRMLNQALVMREQAESELLSEAGLADISTIVSSQSSARSTAELETVGAPARLDSLIAPGQPTDEGLSPLAEEGILGVRPAHCDRFPSAPSGQRVPVLQELTPSPNWLVGQGVISKSLI